MARLLPISKPDSLAMALAELRAGRAVAFPTDTVYGVGTLPDSQYVPLIYKAKRRPLNKPIPLLVASPGDLAKYAYRIPDVAIRLGERCWPGALTIVLPGDRVLSAALGAHDGTIAFRVPDHTQLLSLIQLAGGALAITSANISGNTDSITAEEVKAQLDDSVEVILDGGQCAGGVPSTVVSLAQNPPQITRSGPLDHTVEDVLKTLGVSSK